jgi:hypothetical protein
MIKERFPDVYANIQEYHNSFRNKPKFILLEDNDAEYVLREDFQDPCLSMSKRMFYKADPGHRLTVSHHYTDIHFLEDSSIKNVAITAHDVFANYSWDIIAKTGNPDINNAPYDFSNSMMVKYFRGIIEMEVPLGFMVHKKEQFTSAAFYKFIPGMNLEQLMATGDSKLCNTILWECAKLFSRHITNNVLFFDSHRFNNFYIESYMDKGDKTKQHILRQLDGEFVIPRDKLTEVETEWMIKNFIREALTYHIPLSKRLDTKIEPLLDMLRMEDFLMVCLGDKELMKKYMDSLDNIPQINFTKQLLSN